MKIIIDDFLSMNYPTLEKINDSVLEDAYSNIVDWYSSSNIFEKYIIVNFSKPTIININRRKSKKVTSYKMKFFRNEIFCYCTMKKYGWSISDIEIENIESLESLDIEKRETILIDGIRTNREKEKKIDSILKSKHKNIWKNLTKKHLRNFSNDYEKRPFPKLLKHLKERIENSLNNKESFTYFDSSIKNDYTITIDFDKDEAYLFISNRHKSIMYKIINSTTLIKL